MCSHGFLHNGFTSTQVPVDGGGRTIFGTKYQTKIDKIYENFWTKPSLHS